MRFLRILLVVVLLCVTAATAVYFVRNPEQRDLDAAARATVAGQFVRLSDGVTHYNVTGPESGRTVVLVHGFSVPLYIWDSTVTALSASGYRVVRYDVYGRGLSDRPDVAYDGPLYVRQINELLDSLRIATPVDLMGLSFGGFVTGHYVAAHPDRVRSLTLIDPVASSPEMPALLSWPVVGAWVWQVTQVPGMADNQVSDFLHPEHFPGWPELYRPQMRFRGFGRALLRSALISSRTNYDSLYAGVRRTGVPVLLVWGRQDQTVAFELSDVVRRAIPTLEFFPVDSAGHLPHMEQSSRVHDRMKDFLVAHAGAPLSEGPR